MAVTDRQIVEQLRQVRVPERGNDLVSLDMVKKVIVKDGQVSVTLDLGASADAAKPIEDAATAAIKALQDVEQVTVEIKAAAPSAPAAPAAEAEPEKLLPEVEHIVAVGAGKGGVGKSTISVSIAVALARAGAAVGLLDGDVYGPSLPTMLGIPPESPELHSDGMLEPYRVHGLGAMTMGRLVEADRALVWRGPMAHKAFQQLLTQTHWGALDYMVIDLPPGTGDVPLTMAQMLPLTGAVIVCTPQQVAQDDARRAVRMFEQLEVPVLGMVENMSYFVGDDGKSYDLFGRGGAEELARQMDIPFLGAVPIHMALRENCDSGNPTANFEGEPKLADALNSLVDNLTQRIAEQAGV
jgi:ATP-binding protein involved in chromosome partitioning